MKQCPSPNFNERAEDTRITYVIAHYTGMKDAQSALNRLCDPASKVSAHYVIDEAGATIQLVDESKRAWHAGLGCWRGQTDINSLSIGIELVNTGHEFGLVPFPTPQIDALKDLLRAIYARYGMKPESLLAHSDVSPRRRQDPGELFPWAALANEGFGLWPFTAMPETAAPRPLSDKEINTLLRQVGYNCPDSDPVAVKAARTAFLRRYHPEQLVEGFSSVSMARLTQLTSCQQIAT